MGNRVLLVDDDEKLRNLVREYMDSRFIRFPTG